jgi:hypothetical protein
LLLRSKKPKAQRQKLQQEESQKPDLVEASGCEEL